MNKFIDLRFVIGSFFTVVGILLIIYSFLNKTEVQDVNRWCGGIFIIFGIIMILLSYQKKSQEESH
jgi:uncharacterized membrane protein HdeD (DUF308 family)